MDGIVAVTKRDVVNNSSLAQWLDKLGAASATAQNLKEPVTSSSRLLHAVPDQTVYLLLHDDVPLGLIKVGRKRLFLCGGSGLVEESRMCVLDFYTVRQRMGDGLKLFSHMLEAEKVTPSQLAYDRPSPKLITFLAKHYYLTQIFMHSNRFATLSSAC